MHNYDFFAKFAEVINSNQSRSIVLCGNVYDLFYNGKKYCPLIHFLCEKVESSNTIVLVYELNGPIRFKTKDLRSLKMAWTSWKSKEGGKLPTNITSWGDEFDKYVLDSIGKPTVALEFLRQLTICSRAIGGLNLLIIIEAADLMLPAGNGDIAALTDIQLHRISIMQDWFSDPEFLDGQDSVCLISESRNSIHPRIAKMPQMLSIEVPSPTQEDRQFYINQFLNGKKLNTNFPEDDLARLTAGLSIHAVRQLLSAAIYKNENLTLADIVSKVEDFIQSQIGDDIVEFKKPSHKLEDLVGFEKLKKFISAELIPRFKATDDSALPGAAVAGSLGSGKTYIFEAVAAELDMPVLVLKNIRSQWYGQTDVVLERLKRVLEALEKVVIFIDEADTQFGGVGADEQATERRLTGKIQAMMSDTRFRGKIIWLLMTARINQLSPDIRRPGRVGDLIIPVLDPQGQDRLDFIRWMLKGVGRPVFFEEKSDHRDELIQKINKKLPEDFSSASFASLKSFLRSQPAKDLENFDNIERCIEEFLPPAIGLTRRYQTLQALLNCTRRSLLPDTNTTEEVRNNWEKELKSLELQGIS